MSQLPEDLFQHTEDFARTDKAVLIHTPSLLEYDKVYFDKLAAELKTKLTLASAGVDDLSLADKFVLDLLTVCY